MIRHRFLLAPAVFLAGLLWVGCRGESINSERLTIGVVSYEEGTVSVARFKPLQQYLAEQTNDVIELEPAYNELQALEQIQRQNWSLVFAPPGLAAIAIGQELYVPIFSLEGISNIERSVIVVREESPAQGLADLSNQVVALGEPGSAAGYYLPLYDLYGLTLAEVRFAPTPKTILQWLSQQEVAAGALSEEDFERYRQEFESTPFRILHKSRWIPPGVVLLGPTVERNRQEHLVNVMKEAPSSVIGDAGYVPTTTVPDYEQFIQLVEKVRPLEEQVRETPAVLTSDAE
ncbi:MAG: phosphate/phosphite/phosphonate ABC transporter substrate-binding protein [Cyanophyceae cyanobacterium]